MHLRRRQNSPGCGSLSPMTRGFFILFIVLFAAVKAYALTPEELWKKAEEKKLATSAQWLALLHYKSGVFGGYKSQADGLGFFLSPQGQTNPEAELKAGIDHLFLSGEDDNRSAVCRFPARYLFLKNELGLTGSVLNKKCDKYESFHKRFNSRAISLVFSGYYINTPASTFGHTLLRFKKNNAQGQEGNELLDDASNFAATVTTNNAFIYGVLGLVGGFRGEFSALPYFYKIREYNDYESRDLWDYELSLTPQEIEMAVAHLWEMSTTYFDYFYLTENCSYHILGILDAARPSLRLQERTRYIVIPVDTLKVVAETPGLLRKVSYRPSKRKFFVWQVAHLNKAERRQLVTLIKRGKMEALDTKQAPERQAKILDAAMDYLDFKYADEILIENSSSINLKQELSTKRSELGVVSPSIPMPTPEKEAPHLGHGSRRISLGAGDASKTGRFEQISYRFSLHDLMDRPLGHNRFSTLEMGNFTFRYNEKVKSRGNRSSLWMEDFTLVNVISLSPWDRFFKDFSWRAYFGAKTIREKNLTTYFAPVPSLGAGLSHNYKSFSYYFMIGTEAIIHKKSTHEGVRPALGPELALFYNIDERVFFGLKGNYQYRFFGTDHEFYRYGAEMRLPLSKSLSFDVAYDRFPQEWDLMGKFLFYY